MLDASLLAAAAPALTPSKPWVVEYADSLCLMSRQYGEGPTATVVGCQPLFNDDQMRVIVMSPSTSSRSYSGRGYIQAAGRKKLEGDYFSVFDPKSKQRIIQMTVPRTLLDGLDPLATITLAAKPIGLAIQPLALNKAMVAYKACEANLLKHWELYPATVDVAQPPEGKPWLAFNSDDFPTKALSAGYSGRVVVALQIDPTGHASACRILVSAGTEFDEVTCRKAINARFRPGRDASGQPVAAISIFAVSWLNPG